MYKRQGQTYDVCEKHGSAVSLDAFSGHTLQTGHIVTFQDTLLYNYTICPWKVLLLVNSGGSWMWVGKFGHFKSKVLHFGCA